METKLHPNTKLIQKLLQGTVYISSISLLLVVSILKKHLRQLSKKERQLIIFIFTMMLLQGFLLMSVMEIIAKKGKISVFGYTLRYGSMFGLTLFMSIMYSYLDHYLA